MNLKAFSILFLLVTQFVFSNDTIVSTFNAKKEIEKVSYFRSLHQEDKLNHLSLFKNKFLEFKNKNTSNKTKEKPFVFVLGLIDQLDNKHIKAISRFNQLLDNKDYKLTDNERMDIYVAIQESYLKLNLYSKVFDSNKQINTLIKKGVDYPLWSYNIQSRLYLQLQQVDKAIIQLKKEIEVLKQNPKRDSLIIPSAYNDLGYFYSLVDKNDSALIYYNKAIFKAKQGKSKIDSISYRNLTLNVNGNIASVFLTQKKYDNVIAKLNHLDSIYFKPINNFENYTQHKIILAKAFLGKKNFLKTKSIIEYLDSLNPNTKTKNIHLLSLKQQYAQQTNDFGEAYKNLLLIKKINDSISTLQKNKLLQSSELNFAFEENEKAVIEKNKVIKEKENIIFTIIIIGLTLLLLLSFVLIKNNRRKRIEIEQMNKSISQKNNTIVASLKEKETLLQEIHHRVKNNLQVISGILSLQNSNITDEKSKQLLAESQDRIQSIALLHKTMYQNDNFNLVNFKTYINELITYINQTNKNLNKDIVIKQEIEDLSFSIDTAIPLSMLMNEIITNCYKHAFINLDKGKIFISIQKDNSSNGYLLIVKDNGIGLPQNYNKDKSNSIGFDLIYGLSEQLDGNITINTNNGTEFIIKFKNIK